MNAAQQAAFRLLTTLPVRTVRARPRPSGKMRTKDELEAFADRIRALRAMGWEGKRIAKHLDCAKSTVWRHLQGRKK